MGMTGHEPNYPAADDPNSPAKGLNTDAVNKAMGLPFPTETPDPQGVIERAVNEQFWSGVTDDIAAHNAWLGREDSNLRMAGSKPAALPLGYAPSMRAESMRCGPDHSGSAGLLQPVFGAFRSDFDDFPRYARVGVARECHGRGYGTSRLPQRPNPSAGFGVLLPPNPLRGRKTAAISPPIPPLAARTAQGLVRCQGYGLRAQGQAPQQSECSAAW
jgi:hypothetical protein